MVKAETRNTKSNLLISQFADVLIELTKYELLSLLINSISLHWQLDLPYSLRLNSVPDQ